MRKILVHFVNKIFYLPTVFYQLVLFVVMISVIPLGLVIFVINYKTNDLFERQLLDSCSQIQSQYLSGLKYKLDSYQSSIKNIGNNTIIIDTLEQLSEDKKYDIKGGSTISNELTKFFPVDNYQEVSNYMVYSNSKTSAVYGPNSSTDIQASNKIWYSEYQNREGDFFFYRHAGKNGMLLSMVEDLQYINPINGESKNLGYVKLDLVMNRIFSQSSLYGEKNQVYAVLVLDKNRNILYSSDKKYHDIAADERYEQWSDPEMTEIDRKNIRYQESIVRFFDYEEYGMNIFLFFDVSSLNVEREHFQKTWIPVVLGVFILILLISYMFSKNFTIRVNLLVTKMKQAETGDLSRGRAIEGKDEITILDQHFDRMLYKLEKLIQKNYIQRLENKETELRNLQLQINPHFLYNTLETISSLAMTNKIYIISNLTEKLRDIFQYSLGKNYGEYVPLHVELAYVMNYVYIQKVRFVDKFEVYTDVEKGMEHKNVLRFILQPIVENALFHGLAGQEGQGALEISAYEKGGILKIEIEDDGAGMSEEQVENLYRMINEPLERNRRREKSIGIRNVNQRIKLVYGQEYGIEIRSELHRGSSFIISLPLV